MTFPLSRPARLAVFASGRGSNLAALLEAFPPEHSIASVHLVISNRAEAGALERARTAGVEAVHIPFGNGREEFEREAAGVLESAHIDLICLAGFMRVLSPMFVARYPGRILNIHPSLLPAFPGLRAVERALEAGVGESGCTVHFVDAGVDTGPIIVQRRVLVRADDTADTLAASILAEEHRAYPEAVRRVLAGVTQLEAHS